MRILVALVRITLCAALALGLARTTPGSAQEAPAEAAPEDPEGDPPQEEAASDLWSEAPEPPVYETWWFWTAIGAVVLGITLAIVVGVTTDHPRSTRAGLVIGF